MSDNIHADAAAAFDSLSGSTEPTETPTPAPEPVDKPAEPAPVEKPEPTPTEGGGPTRDASGRFVAKDGTVAPAPKAEETTKTETPKEATDTGTAKPQAGAIDVSRPPPGLGPLARAKWDATPTEVREDFWRREKETSQALRSSVDSRKFQEEWTSTLAQYEPVFRMEGVDARTGTRNLLQAVAALRMGNEDARAEIVASVVRNYGVPPEKLLQRLGVQMQEGQAVAPQGPSPELLQLQQQFNAVVAELQDIRSSRETASKQYASKTIDDFKRGHEYWDDVKEDVAVFYQSGMELEDAYDRAVWANPQTRQLLMEKQGETKAQGQQAQVARARAASVSVRSAPVATPKAPVGKDHHSAAEAAWNELVSRGG